MTDSHALLSNALDALHLASFKAGDKRWLGQLHGSSAALLLSEWLQREQCLMVVIARHQQHLAQLEREFGFYGVKPSVFADWETLPYDRLSPHQDIISERLDLLVNMPKCGIVLIAATTLVQRVAPPEWLYGQHFDIKVGEKFDIAAKRAQLIAAGYHAVETVYEHGEFAIRGSLMDIFASGQAQPVRIDLFDDEVESLRFFDIETQRTTEKIAAFRILPAKEFPLHEGRSTFRNRYAELFPQANPKRSALYQDVMDGIAAPGLEYYLPLFFEAAHMQRSQFLDYVPLDAMIVHTPEFEQDVTQFWQDIERRYADRSHDKDHPILAPQQLFLSYQALAERINQHPRLMISETAAPERQGSINVETLSPPMLQIEPKRSDHFGALKQWLDNEQLPTLIVAESAGRRETLKDALGLQHLTLVNDFAEFITLVQQQPNQPPLALTHGSLERGLWLPHQLAIVTESQLYEQRIIQTRRRQSKKEVSEEFLIRSLTELSIGAPVVHVDYGVGRYAGLVPLDIDNEMQEFLQINYADDAKVYVPVTNLHLISRFSGGDPDLAPLHRLGTDQWHKAKRKALEQIHDVAAELLHVHARRQAKPGYRFQLDEAAYHQFVSGFLYEETLDQHSAIEATLHDMQQARPMDRLVCGDVGFGKTEVAMRAAFVAAQNGKQVAVLVPTTLLAQQHFESFRDRFADTAIRIEVLSRFGSSKTHQAIIAAIAEGKVDIVIGTHKILQEQVKFKDLGLMIVDEEHRFGVRDKERIKALRADVDMLTLTATPIPRTLNMAFSGMRDLSIIATPPARRLAVKTFVMDQTDATIKEAILRELLRGGQVYFLHNDVDSIERTAENLRLLLPEARVAVAHGQMHERQLEQVMQQFYHKQYNVLVCSTIIETGIDVPSANTIIIERADKLGLAQLHQLRGRVGRSHHQAYAYLLVPSVKHLKGDAEKRLDAIQRANTLGAGFILATEDLEIRGAGEILGEQQSGSMQAIGYSLYMEMLEKATKAISQGRSPNFDAPLNLTADINLHVPALIPDNYLGDVHQRLLFYKRISNAASDEKLHNIRNELIDRFGSLPSSIQYLFAVHGMRIAAEQLGIAKIDIAKGGGAIEFLPDTPVQAMTIIQLMQKQPNDFRMDGGQRLKVIRKIDDHDERIKFVQDFVQYLKSQTLH